MEKLISTLLMIAMLFTLCACSQTAAQSEASPAAEVTAEPEVTVVSEPEVTSEPEEDTGIEASLEQCVFNALDTINDIQPGSAGSSLRVMAAVGTVLDLSTMVNENTDKSDFTHTCKLWFDANLTSAELRSDFSADFLAMWDPIHNYLNNPAAYADDVAACGYTFGSDSYNVDKASFVLDCMSIAQRTEPEGEDYDRLHADDDNSELIKQLLGELMSDILTAGPGSAGSSLREMAAACKLLDLSTLYDESKPNNAVFASYAYEWVQANLTSEELESAFSEAWLSVFQMANGYINNPSDYEGLIADCGTEPTFGVYDWYKLDRVCTCISLSMAKGE